MTLANLEIYSVMSRRNFQHPRAELGIDRFVSDDWNFLAREWTPCVFAQKIGITFVARMKSHRGIRHDGFRSGGSDFEKTTRFFHDLVANEIKFSFLRLRNDFFIRERSLR